MQVKASATPKVIYFTNKNKAYLYEGPLKSKSLRNTFISDDHGYLKHKLFSEDTADIVQKGISQMMLKHESNEATSLPLLDYLLSLLDSLIGENITEFFRMIGRDHWSRKSQLQITGILLAGPIVSWILAKALNATVWKYIK